MRYGSVSVVIPSYNRPDATMRAVSSVVAQTYSVDEIVVVDDASTIPLDAERLQAMDTRVRILPLDENRGAAGARQAGVDAARGEVLAFLDSDDLWRPGKLAAQLPLLKRRTAVSCGWEETGLCARHQIRHPREAYDPSLFFAGCWFCPGSTVIIGRTDFLATGPLDRSLSRLEDLDWFIRFGLAGGRLHVAPHVGAEIAIGARARIAPVEAASRTIEERYAGRSDVSKANLRTLRAWLRVERAKAAWNDGKRSWALWHLAMSGRLRPRARLQLEDWWPEPRP